MHIYISSYIYTYMYILIYTYMCVCTQSLNDVQLCDPMNCSPPGSSLHGISQVRILEWVAISYSRGSSWPKDRTHVSCIGRWILYHWTTCKTIHISITTWYKVETQWVKNNALKKASAGWVVKFCKYKNLRCK